MKHLFPITATLLLLLTAPSRAQETETPPAAQTAEPAQPETPAAEAPPPEVPAAETPPAEAPATTEAPAAETPGEAQAEVPATPAPRTEAEIAADKVQIGIVALMQGQLSATNAAGEKRALSNGSPIFRNEDIVAEANSKAQLLLTDDTLVSVAENTTFKIRNYVYQGAEAPAATETPAAETPAPAGAETPAGETPAAEASAAEAPALANGNTPPHFEMALGSLRTLGGKTNQSGEQGIKVFTPEAEVTAEGTMFKVTTTEAGTAVGVHRGSVRVTNPAGSVMLGKKGHFDYTILPAGDNGRPAGQLSAPGALAALEATGPGETVTVASAVSEDLKARFKLKPLSYTELHDLRRSMRLGGRFADRMMIKLRDRQVDLHSDGIECGTH